MIVEGVMAKKPTVEAKIERIVQLIREADAQAAGFPPSSESYAYYSGVAEGLNYAYKILTGRMSLRYTPWR